MTHQSDTEHPVRQGVAAGTSIAAGVVLATVGVLSVLQGISAVIADQIYVVGVEYLYRFDTTVWGWTHTVLGLLLFICSIGLMTGTLWGRIGALVVTALSIIANFLSLPYYPAWSMLIIGLNIVVIWAVATWRPALD
ncbi:hypothetical protein [Nocardia sp. NPDC052566]|uniref:DUF7144 family membrane protein n=1 Tax=Nocardia sp. NPDC052566 TaxID=3364330 RepID=UPI0037C9D7FC